MTLIFRTQLAHGLLVHHAILNQSNTLGYDLYIKLEKGKLLISHIVNNEVTSVPVGRGIKEGKPYYHILWSISLSMLLLYVGLSNNMWHDVRLFVDPNSGNLTIVMDEGTKKMTSHTFQVRPYHDLHENEIDTVLFFGGLNPEDTFWAQQYGYQQFIGCLGNVELRVNGTKLQKLKTFSHSQVFSCFL